MHVLKTGLNTDKFTPFGCFRNGFITHSLCKTLAAERKITKHTKMYESG